MVDEDYQLVAAHIDETLRRKIQNTEYVDFARLLPRDRVLSDNSRLELINRDGKTYFVPADSREVGAITSFFKWEQVFRVFANVYTEKYPQKATELIQYNHLINMASMTFIWDNVYMYDKDFRMHLSRHPYRSWAIMLQQAWSVRLKDKIRNSAPSQGGSGFHTGCGQVARSRKDICWRYNSGRCTYGSSCKFEHKCSVCLRYGHGAHICRRANWEESREDTNQRDHSNDERKQQRSHGERAGKKS